MSDRELQLEVLIQASVDRAMEKAKEAFDKRAEALARKNEELLAEKKHAQGKAKVDRLLAAADKLITTPTYNPYDRPQSTTSRIVFDPTKHTTADYKRMKADAAKRGAEFQVLTRSEQLARPLPASPVAQFDDKNAGVRYIPRALLDRYSLVRLSEMASREGLRVRVYNSPDELSDDARALHDIAAKGEN